METQHTPISPEEKTEIAKSFYEDFKRTFKNFKEEKDPERKRWAYRFLFLEEARDEGTFDMTSKVGFRHTDHIDDSISILSEALKLADKDPELEEGHFKDSLISRLRRHMRHIQADKETIERKGLPQIAEPKDEAQEIEDAIGRMTQEIQANIQEHGKASYVTEKTPDNPTATTNREPDYQPENRVKLSKILLGTSTELGRATLRDPDNKDKYQEIRLELQAAVLKPVIDAMGENEEIPPFLDRMFPVLARRRRQGRKSKKS